MKKHLTAGLVMGLLIIQSAHAVNCDFKKGTADQVKTNLTSEMGMLYCQNPTIYVNSDGVGFYSCESGIADDPCWYEENSSLPRCADETSMAGLQLMCREVPVPGCNLTFYECAYNYCTGFADQNICVDSKNWVSSITDGYQEKWQRTCGADDWCNEHAVYQCAPGYYGTSADGVSGCNPCPLSGGTRGTSPAGTTSIIGCFLPVNTTFSDGTGNGAYTDNCYYKN